MRQDVIFSTVQTCRNVLTDAQATGNHTYDGNPAFSFWSTFCKILQQRTAVV